MRYSRWDASISLQSVLDKFADMKPSLPFLLSTVDLLIPQALCTHSLYKKINYGALTANTFAILPYANILKHY